MVLGTPAYNLVLVSNLDPSMNKISNPTTLLAEASIADRKAFIVRELLARGLETEARKILGEDAPYSYGLASLETEKWLIKFITQHKLTQDMLAQIRVLSNYPDSVLIQGELLARALRGPRKGEFIDINCAGLPETLVESELFGHVKGAFTGAIADKTGLLRIAQHGVIFLDEIGELGLGSQAKLLRALQERVVRQVGGNKNDEINCRVVAATHHNLEALVKSGRFREDLFYRLSTFTLDILPLRQRACDVTPILLHYLGDNLKAVPADFPELNFDFPGNVRYLQAQVRRYKILVKRQLDYTTT